MESSLAVWTAGTREFQPQFLRLRMDGNMRLLIPDIRREEGKIQKCRHRQDRERVGTREATMRR
jgi:hypothetical protein